MDFCKIILRTLENNSLKGTYDISGLEKINYIDLMSMIKYFSKSKTIFIFLPIQLFDFLLKIWSFVSPNPAFTSSQLKALTAGDEFEIIDWPNIFSIKNTPLKEALEITFGDQKYSKVFIPF